MVATDAAGMPLQMTSLAEKLKAGGYETHYVGKWDLGHTSSCLTPYYRGWDTFIGFFGHSIDPHAGRVSQARGRGTEVPTGGRTEGCLPRASCMPDPHASDAVRPA